MNLQDTVCVVTGASRGLGHHFAQTLTQRGATVYGLARSADDLHDVRDDLGDAFHPVECDVRSEGNIQRAFQTVTEQAGRLDALVNNAGLGRFDDVADASAEDWDTMIETNLRGTFLCARAALPAMKAQNEKSGFGGHIINIASIAGLVGNAGLSGYNASKFGVRGFSLALMKEVREDGIKVSCVYPGSVETSFGDGPENPLQPADVAQPVRHLLETPDNYLISELVVRPLRPKG
jgi:NAD(P)-dependent dehydrogenase (short-subunit alcohol dehydrogenase family)